MDSNPKGSLPNTTDLERFAGVGCGLVHKEAHKKTDEDGLRFVCACWGGLSARVKAAILALVVGAGWVARGEAAGVDQERGCLGKRSGYNGGRETATGA